MENFEVVFSAVQDLGLHVLSVVNVIERPSRIRLMKIRKRLAIDK